MEWEERRCESALMISGKPYDKGLGIQIGHCPGTGGKQVRDRDGM